MMKQYDSYKDSGVQWIGEIPSHWDMVKIKYDFTIYPGATPKTENENFWDGEIIWITPADYKTNDKYVKAGQRKITKEGYESCNTQLVPEGSLIFSKRAPIGTVAISGADLCTNQGCLSCVPKNVDVLYFYYIASVSTELFDLFGSGTTFKEISADVFANIKLPLPSLNEQKTISAYLDKKCEKINKAIATQQKRIDLLGELRQNIITHAVTHGINPDAPLKDSGVEWIGEVPEHWKIMPIKYVKSKAPNAFVDGPFGSNLKSEHFIENGEVLVIESGFITTGKFVYKDFKTISKEHFETIKRSQCKAHDIIIAKIGANYGMAGELPDLGKLSVVSGNSLKITLDNSKMLNTIFVNAMNSAKNNSGFMGMVQENAQPALSLSGLNNFKLPVPPLSEQLEILSHIESKTDSIDKSIAKAERQIELLQELKQSIITEVVTGKRKVC